MGRPNYEDSVADGTPEETSNPSSDSSIGYLQHSADQGSTIGLLNESANGNTGVVYGTHTEAGDSEA
jgi:hypothetical protein